MYDGASKTLSMWFDVSTYKVIRRGAIVESTSLARIKSPKEKGCVGMDGQARKSAAPKQRRRGHKPTQK
jgi:hypothetical protein